MMIEQVEIVRQEAAQMGVSAVLPAMAEHFARTAVYAAPEVVTFPLNGLRIDTATLLTGNS